MNENTMLKRLQDIFRDVFGNDEIILEKTTSANDIEGWDSITHISVLEAVQDEFGIKLSLDEMIELTDAGKILEAVSQRIPQKDKPAEDETDVWNSSYGKGGNIVFYPHEEIIRFVNRFVRKRYSFDGFEDRLPLLEDPSFASLDLGCGIGRHVKFLDEFHLNPFGIDLSDTAIEMGKKWFINIGKKELADKMIVASVAELPFPDDNFGIIVSHGVLDSMPRDIAVEGLKEVKRVLKNGGLMYLDLIMENGHDGDEIVKSGMEEGTTQSYFTVDSIKQFLKDFEIIDFNIISWSDEKGNTKNKRAHLVIKNVK